MIARGLKLPPEEVELILHASRMHDVGKIAVPESILRKPSTLDAQEWTVMRAALGDRQRHSRQLVVRDSAGRPCDGALSSRAVGRRRLPERHRGPDIPLWGRICAVGDVFDAVTSERPYKPAFPNEEALADTARRHAGSTSTRVVVDAFFECFDDILAIQVKYKDE